jgi:hypothetical protein
MRSIGVAIAFGALVAVASSAIAGEAVPAPSAAGLHDSAPHVLSAQARTERRPPRVRIHRDSRPLGPDAVRQCEAWYEREFRPSGTVIVPRMSCFWRRG